MNMAEYVSPNNWDPSRSPYASILNTNHVPSAAEFAELRTLLLEPQQTLSELESEISHLQAVLNQRLSERDRVKSFIDAHRALMSPIRQLPAETLAEIFVNCPPTGRYPVRSLDEAPLILTTVCRSWRDIAINTPRLWNSLHIHFPSEMSPEAFACREQGIILWLNRSGSLPLFLSLTIMYTPAFLSLFQHHASFLRSLMRFGHRFDDIALDLDLAHFNTLESLAIDGFPAMESLLVQLGGPPFQESDRCSFASTRLPSLQRLGLFYFPGAQLTASAFGWQNLTELFLEPSSSSSVGPVGLFSILGQTPRLELCHIAVDIRGDVAATQQHSVYLPRLHTISIILNVSPAVNPSVRMQQ